MRRISPLILHILLVVEFAHAADKQSVPDFSGYPPVLGFLSCINLHTNAARNLQHTNLLVVSEFYRMDRLGGDMLQYVVTEGGQTLNYVDNGDGIVNDPRRKQLSEADLRKLRAAIHELPTTNQYPWLSTLVILSHRDGTNWVTHSYARSSTAIKEAPALRDILNILGERPEAQTHPPF
jgi:hypothetical protein